MDAVAEDGAQLAADLLVEEACDEGVEPGAGGRLDGQAVLAAEAAPAHFDGPVEEVADELGLLGEAVLQLRVDHFIDARHGHEDRGADLAEVGLQVRDGAVEGGGVAQTEREVVGGRAFEGVRERQEREEGLVTARLQVLEHALDVRDDVAVREHHALGVARGARGVDERGEVGGLGSLLGQLARFAELEEGLLGHDGNRRLQIVAVLVVGDDDEADLGRLGGLADLLPLEELVGHEDLGTGVVQDEGGGLRRVDGVQRHRHERVRERGEVEEDRFGAVGQEHRHAVAANEFGARREGMAPGVDLIVDVLEGEILPGLGRIVVDLVGNVVGPDGQVMRQEFGKRRKDVKRLDAFKAVVRKVLGIGAHC